MTSPPERVVNEHPTRDMLVVALWMGLSVGLLEGLGWLGLQRVGRLTGVWTQVLWIAPLLNGLVFLLCGLALVPFARLVSNKTWLSGAGFVVALGASANLVALTLQSYVHLAAQLILALGLASTLNGFFQRRRKRVVQLMRRSLPGLLALVLAIVLTVQGFYLIRERTAVTALAATDDSAPNVVMVIIDALRADRMSAYGSPRETTPFIDGLAREGVLFERAYSAAPYTLPSHASLLSGLYPSDHGVEWLDFDEFAKRDYPSIAESMRDLGYRTGAFSANPFWFSREQGFGRGFIRFEDFYHNVSDMAGRTVFGKAFERVRPHIGLEDVPARKSAELNTDLALRWIAQAEEHPFFAVINYFDVHDPYLPVQPYRGRFWNGGSPGGILNWRLLRIGPITDEETASELAAYDGALAYVDHELRRLVEQIQSVRPDRDLVLIITSDHGEAFGEHGAFLHAKSLYREEIQIPLVLWAPGRIPAGARVPRPVSHASIPATVLDLVSGLDAPRYGEPSLRALWADSTAAASWPWPRSEIRRREWEEPEYKVTHGDIHSLATPDWYFIVYDSLPPELFASDDVLQERDRAGDPEVRSLIDELRSALTGAGRAAAGPTGSSR